MGKRILLFCVVFLSCFVTPALAYNYPNGTEAKPGDILVTSDTSSSGILGHAGIVVDKNRYLETKGPGYFPKIYNLKSWFSDRSTTKVVRIGNVKAARDAASFAKTWDGAKVPYKITNNLLDNHYTYCSKLVWQIYALHTQGIFPVEAAMEGKLTIWPPYNFLNSRVYLSSAKPKLVYKKRSNW
ncbi:YiiX/YebB-like N1pC/P60 family cysteine hydrolase [Virgibacillus halophilus]|uniref:YiiX/YebB-like N1pC/P60 family cysteine hydrolase n=1 Tax=Tigheibacillus halophilus TaxID=361280 RepID=A0ABU5CDV7_9BACI|nr:YiiX/YebB-like N1pC/P60 family cysteine hydrolase [Virgibacillus halophilus]